jgi:trans-2,3-dihydro-3-hydroxyanthranilate isomerase
LVDVFAERPLSGNQLCVVPEPRDLTSEKMLALAREIGFSETTFVTSAGADRYAMRIFTPGGELPFAGHPTLGTAYVLVSEGVVTSPAVQEVAAGEFTVEVDVESSTAIVHQHVAEFGEVAKPLSRVAEAAGLELDDLHRTLRPELVSTGLPVVIVPAATPEAVARARPDDRGIWEIVNETAADCIYVIAVTGPGEAKARLFAPDLGVPEDPATGGAAGPLGAYLARHGEAGLPGRLLVRQGEEIGRPSLLQVDVEPDGDSYRVAVSGRVFVVGQGAFRI